MKAAMHWVLDLTVTAICAVAIYLAAGFAWRMAVGGELPPQAPMVYEPSLPEGAETYRTANETQAIAHFVGGQKIIDKVSIGNLPKKWHQSGGMEGIPKELWRSEKFRHKPNGTGKTWLGDIDVGNSFGYKQTETGIVQEFPDGTRFDDVLRNADSGLVFEHRVRQKVNGKWQSKVVFKDESQFPKGYKGLKVTCASCHDQAGTGEYGVGLVPGGDTVLSEPLDWSLVEGKGIATRLNVPRKIITGD